MFTVISSPGPEYKDFADKAEAISYADRFESSEVLDENDFQVFVKWPQTKFV